MVDFSNISHPPLSSYVRSIERGDDLRADAFLLAIEEIQPPLLDDEKEMAALKQHLQSIPTIARGVAKAGQSRAQLAASVAKVQRPDVPGIFIKALAAHLAQPRKGKVIMRKLGAELAEWRRRDRNTVARGLYPMFYELADRDGPWQHERLGHVPALDKPAAARSERALQLTVRWLSNHGFDPPSESTLRNIVSLKRASLRE